MKEENRKKFVYIIVAITLIFIFIWGVSIIPKQLEFNNNCKKICLSKNMNYSTEFFSYPWNVNGKCYCVYKLLVNIQKQLKGGK